MAEPGPDAAVRDFYVRQPGYDVAVTLSGGQVSDVKGYSPVMDQPGPWPRVLLADKGY